MKKLIISICTVLLILSAPLAAFEWGGVIKDDTGIVTPDFKAITFKQSNAISLWFKAPLGDSNFKLTGEGLYKYNFTANKAGKDFVNIVDLTLFKLDGKINAGSGLLTINAGRFSVADTTGAVFAQTSDGISVAYALDSVKLGLYAGYTGLLNGLNVAMAVAPEKQNKVYNMAYAFAPIGLTIELPSLFLNQNLTLQGYALLDCGANKSNMFYANIALAGPITNSVYYNLASSFGSVKFKNFMNYTGLTVYIFPADEIAVNAGIDFGTAAQSKLAAFTSASAKSADVSGKIAPKVGFTYGTDVMCFDFGAKYKIAYDTVKAKYAGAGADINAGFVYNIFSDLQVGLNVTAAIDTTAAKQNNYTANLNIALAF